MGKSKSVVNLQTQQNPQTLKKTTTKIAILIGGGVQVLRPPLIPDMKRQKHLAECSLSSLDEWRLTQVYTYTHKYITVIIHTFIFQD